MLLDAYSADRPSLAYIVIPAIDTALGSFVVGSGGREARRAGMDDRRLQTAARRRHWEGLACTYAVLKSRHGRNRGEMLRS